MAVLFILLFVLLLALVVLDKLFKQSQKQRAAEQFGDEYQKEEKEHIKPKEPEISQEISPPAESTTLLKDKIKTPSKKQEDQISVKQLEIAYIQVGIDFGTSYTKVCYSITGMGNKVHPVYFEEDSCFFPSLIAFDNSKVLFGNQAMEFLSKFTWESGIKNFKTLFAAKYNDAFQDTAIYNKYTKYLHDNHLDEQEITPEYITAVYISYVLSYVREYLHKQRVFVGKNLDITFNICIPVDYIENNTLKEKYEHAFAVADVLSKEFHRRNYDLEIFKRTKELFSSISIDDKDETNRIFTIPETVAQISSYSKSLGKEKGIHAVIDIGAGTTDISIFNLVLFVQEDCSFFYASQVFPFGMHTIEKIIFDHFKSDKEYSQSDILAVLKALQNLPYRIRQKELTRKINAKVHEFRHSDNGSTYNALWGKAYQKKMKVSEWENVKIFICGGGSRLYEIEQYFKTPWYNGIRKNFQVDKIPEPYDFDSNAAEVPFYRMAVAYGLCTPKPMLDKYRLPNDCPDQTPVCVKKKLALDRDELYPRR